MDTRQLTRKKLQQQRAKISLSEQKKTSAIITEQLSQHPLFLQSRSIASYKAIQHEIDPSALIHKAWQNKQTCYLPVLYSQQLNFSQGGARMSNPRVYNIHEDCELSGKTDKNLSARSIQGHQLIFCAYQPHTLLKKNRFNIPEPSFSLDSCIAPQDIDLVLVPLVGFTEKGQRLGMGAGFYDRSFAFLLHSSRPARPFLLGLAYEWQKLATLKEKNWDVPLNAIITEKKIYYAY
jgi:5-formyltetrahydrofolate cyclo-ligase